MRCPQPFEAVGLPCLGHEVDTRAVDLFRRSRGFWRGVALVAVATAVAGVLLALGHDPRPRLAGQVPAARGPAERTLTLGAGSGWAVDEYDTEPTWQQLSVHDGHETAQIAAYEPGTFEAGQLNREQPVRLGTQDAWFLHAKVPTLEWETTGGVLVTVSGGADRAAVVRLAGAVRLEPPVPVVGPIGLAWVPTGLVLTEARIGNGTAVETFTAYGRRSYTLRLYAYSVTSNEWTNGTIGAGTPGLVVALHPAWYSEPAGGGSQVLLEVGSCGVRLVTSDRDRVPVSVLERLVAGATFGSCDDAQDWPPILG
jgi:hypothetical protein